MPRVRSEPSPPGGSAAGPREPRFEEAPISKSIESSTAVDADAHPPLRAASAPFSRLLYWIARLPYRAPDRPGTGTGAGAQKVMVRGWYQFLTFMDRRASMIFMNYGYAPAGPGPGDAAIGL